MSSLRKTSEFSLQITRHLQIEVTRNPVEVKVYTKESLIGLLQEKFEKRYGKFQYIEISDRYSLEGLVTETSIKPAPHAHVRCDAEALKMAIVMILEDEGFKLISMVLDQASGTEKLMMYKNAQQ